MFSLKSYGNFEKTMSFFDYVLNHNWYSILVKYAERGVRALRASTPMDTGETASSWGYQIAEEPNKKVIYFTNDEVTANGTPIAILIQYGHATKNGGFVQGIDFINPALQPVFEDMADELWGDIINA